MSPARIRSPLSLREGSESPAGSQRSVSDRFRRSSKDGSKCEIHPGKIRADRLEGLRLTLAANLGSECPRA